MSYHARQRAMERYNINLNYADQENIISLLEQGRGIPLDIDTQVDNRCFAYVVYKNIPLKILYEIAEDKSVLAIITTYPLNVDEYNEVSKEIFDSQIEMCIKFLETNGYKASK